MDYLPLIRPILVSGCNPQCKGNWQYDSEDRVVVSFGKVLTVIEDTRYSVKNLRKFPTSKDEMNLIALSYDKTLCAVAFRALIPYIYVVDLSKNDKFHLLQNPLNNNGFAIEYVAMDFSVDNRYVGAILGPPDWLLLCYRWVQDSLRNYTKAVYSIRVNTVTCNRYNPFDRKTMMIMGNNLFRQANIKKTRWEDCGYCTPQKKIKVRFTTGCWVTKREALVGTKDGRLFVITLTRILHEYKAHRAFRLVIPDVPDQTTKEIYHHRITRDKYKAKGVYMKEVDNMIIRKDRLAFSLGRFEILVYRNVEPGLWKISDLLDLSLNPHFPKNITHLTPTFTSISINKTLTKLLTGMSDGRAYEGKITEVTKGSSNEFLKSVLLFYGPSLNHYQGVQCVATCLWKTIFITVGRGDGLVKVWDYRLRSAMFTTHYRQGVYSASIHPGGLFVLLGMRHYLDLCVFSVSAFKKYYRFETKRCKVSCFSEDGSMLAYSRESFSENSVVLVNSITFECIRVFENQLLFDGGELKILSDTHLVNMVDGMYQVRQNIQVEEGEESFKNMKIEELDELSVFNNGVITEFKYDTSKKACEFTRECFVPTFVESNLKITKTSNIRNFVVYGFEDGRIMTTAKPYSTPFSWTLTHIHNKTITRISLTRNDEIMLTADKSGTIVIWRLGNLYTDRMKMTHFPLDILSNHTLIEDDDDDNTVKESEDLRYNFPLSDPDKYNQLFFKRVAAVVLKPIQDHYDYLFDMFTTRAKHRGTDQSVKEQKRLYKQALQLKAMAVKLRKKHDEIDKMQLRYVKKARETKKEMYDKAMTNKLNYMALLNSSRCFTKFFAYGNLYSDYHDMMLTEWGKSRSRLAGVERNMVKTGEYICRMVYIGMRKEFVAKANVLTNLECFIKTQIATILDLKRKLLLRKRQDLDEVLKEMGRRLIHIFKADLAVNKLDVLSLHKNLITKLKLFNTKKHKIVGESIRSLLEEFHARQLFLKFDQENWSENLKRSEIALDAYWLEEWGKFKEIYADYLFVRLCAEDLAARISKRKKRTQQEKRFALKKKCKIQSRNNDTKIFSDLFMVTLREVKNKGDKFYNLMEMAWVLNSDSNLADSYFTKLLVLTTYRPKEMLTNDMLYNIETYDICMRLIREEEEIIDQRVQPKRRRNVSNTVNIDGREVKC